jgi:predicted NUDIX family NTP pyrophosphohydrolase
MAARGSPAQRSGPEGPGSRSAGLLPFRHRHGVLEVFLVHPGGPFWARRDAGAWSLAKGEYGPAEDPLEAAKREFQEETGFSAEGEGEFLPLGEIRQPGGKQVTAWAFRGDFDPALLRSNRFTLEWPPRSGRLREFPEVDRGAWFTLAEARRRVNPGQRPLLEALHRLVGGAAGSEGAG